MRDFSLCVTYDPTSTEHTLDYGSSNGSASNLYVVLHYVILNARKARTKIEPLASLAESALLLLFFHRAVKDDRVGQSV